MGGYLSNQIYSEDYSDDDSSYYTEDEKEEISDKLQKLDIKDKIDFDTEYGMSDGLDNCMDSATDSVTSSTAAMTINVTLDQVLFVENQLDLYEKVSLVYLLYDDPQTAYQELKKLLNGGSERLLYNWAIHQNLSSKKWKEKFTEALCIIQNYQLLRTLGFQRKDLDEHFLPHQMFTVLYVNKVRKALYSVCEHMTKAEAEKMLRFVYSDFNSKELHFEVFDSSYLELYFLYWESIAYIKQDNLNNLYCILKQMEVFDMVDKLKQIVPDAHNIINNQRIEKNLLINKNKAVDASSDNKNTNKKSSNIFEGILNSKSSLFDLMSMESHISADNAVYVSDGNKYRIDPNNPGICLIINQEDFYTEIDPKCQSLLPTDGNKLESRTGTQKDKEDLEATFKMFNFRTEVVDNLTHNEMVEKIEEVTKRVTLESSLFICIMSHGDEGVIYGVNSCKVSVKTLQNLICSKNRNNLSGKPKILILQSCQGNRCQKLTTFEDQLEDVVTTDGPTFSNNLEIVPPRADLFTFWATVPGYGAIRNKKTGSWFIQSFCEKMKELGNKLHFEDICTAVICDVSSKTWNKREEHVAMVPLKDSTLRKLFYLPPMSFNDSVTPRHNFD